MSDTITIWVVTPHESMEYDEWWGPAETEEDHDAALSIAYDRLCDLFDQYDSAWHNPVGTVSIEMREVDPEDVDWTVGPE